MLLAEMLQLSLPPQPQTALPHIKVLYPLVALPHIKVHFTVLARFHRTHFYPQYSCASFGWDREYAVKHLGAWCYRHIYEGS